jgi:hypothetical protein
MVTEALKAARDFIENDRQALAESLTVNGEIVFEDDIDRNAMAEYVKVLVVIDGAIEQALAAPVQGPVAAKKDAVFAASIEFIGTLTGMKPPPIEVAPPEVLKPFSDFTEKVCAIFATTSPAQAAPVQEPVEMSPEFTDTARDALLWVLWHHQGGSSQVGQPIRFALGMGAHERLSAKNIAEAKKWANKTGSITADFHTTPPAAPVQFNEELHQERERRQQLEAELMRMQGRELKLQMALNTPAQPAPVQEPEIDGATIAGMDASIGHLSALVDELRLLLGCAMDNFKMLHNAAKPDDGQDMDAIIPAIVFAKFVNQNAALRYAIKHSAHDGMITTPPAQPAVPLTDERVGRTDREIVDQTEELAGFLMRAFHRREKAGPLSTFRGTQDIRAQHCWQIACQIQEMLTDTDPMNAVANVDDEAAHGITKGQP